MSEQPPEAKRPKLNSTSFNGSSVRPKVAFVTGITGQVSPSFIFLVFITQLRSHASYSIQCVCVGLCNRCYMIVVVH